jgi:hypothetical protein
MHQIERPETQFGTFFIIVLSRKISEVKILETTVN